MVKKHIIPLVDLFKAYYSCRKNKRNTINALAFELNLEENLIALKTEIESGNGIVKLNLNAAWSGTLFITFEGDFGLVHKKIIKL